MNLKLLLILLAAFTVNLLTAQCDFAVELKDSQSNGWAGSSLDLSVNGTLIYDDLSISNNQDSEVFTFSVNNNDAIEVIWNPGAVGQDETSYSILDNTGSTLITKTATDLQSNEINVVCATCSLPQNIQLEYANNPLGEARFSFDLASSQQLNSWTYEWVIMPQGQSPDISSAVENGTIGYFSYSGLNQEITTSVDTSTYSNFDFYIRTNCEDLSFSQWSSNLSFCFNCGQSDPLKPPYFEQYFFNFDTELGYTEGDEGSLASGPSETGQGNWGTSWNCDVGVGAGFEEFKVSMDGSGDVSWLILPTFDLSDTDHIMIYELRVAADNNNIFCTPSDMGSDDVVYLVYKTSSSSSWTILEDYDNSDGLSTVSSTEEIDLSAITSPSVQIAFVAFENASDPEDYDFFVDEIGLLSRDPCQRVFENLSVDQVTSNTADINWDASPDEVNGYDWYVFNDNDNPLFATPIQTGSTSPGNSQVSITGLASQTDYDFYVKTNCSSSQSKFSPVLDFSTVCGVFSAPFSESFEPTSNTEECWTTINANNDNESWSLDDPGEPNQGEESASVGGIFDDGDDDWLISPQLNLSGSEILSFAVRSSSSNNPSNLEVLLSTTGNDPADFSTVLLPNNTINGFYVLKTIDLSNYSGNIYIAWYVNNTSDSHELFVDDIEMIDCSASMPYAEDFESGSIDQCWSRTNTGQSFVDSGCGSNNGSFLRLNGGNHTTETNSIDVSGETSIDVSYEIYNGCSETSDPGETLTVDYWDGSAWQNIVTYDPANLTENWSIEKFTISTGLTADFKLRFDRSGGSTGFDDLDIDNLLVEATPSCPAPTGLTNTATTFSKSVLSWNAIGNANNGYEYVVMINGNSPDTSTAVATGTVSAGTTIVQATGLTAETDYDAYVRSDCGGGDISDWSAKRSFTTPADFCAGELATDSGGVNADYPYNAHETITICPDNTGDKVVINFSEFSFENLGTSCYDGLTIYDGDDTSATIINPPSGGTRWCWDRDDQTPLGSGDLLGVSIAATSSSGCITLVLESDGIANREGFVASVSCESTVYLWNGSSWENQPVGSITANDNLYVNSGGAPSLTGSVSTNDLYIDNGATLEASNGDVNVSGNLNNYGTLSGSNDILMNAATGQSVYGSGSIDNLTVDNGNSLTIEGEQTITDVLRLINGDITTNNNLIFKSDASGTAQLADVNGNSIAGNVMVERFIPVLTEDTRAFRFLTSAVDTNASIFDNWQEGGNSPAGYGTHITGAQGTVGNISSQGFDETFTGNASMYTFDNSFTGSDQSNAWEEISDTDNGRQLNAGEAYRIFIRGDRNYNLDAAPGDADFGPNSNVTLRATGLLAIGNRMPTLSDQAGYYSLVGNPYQAIIDMAQVLNATNATNVNTNYYWVWDPNMSSSGAYVAVDLSSGNLSNPDNINVSSSEANNYVMPGQSFFVQTVNNATAELTFTEAVKDVNPSPTTVFSDDEMTSLNLKLFKTYDLNNNEIESDALQIDFSDQYSNLVTIEDANKLGNPDENLARLNNGKYLTIEKRVMPVDGESLSIYTDGYTVTDYTFVITLNDMPQNVSAYFIDDHTTDQILLSEGENQISFAVDSSLPGSIATDRFSIAFENDTFGIDDQEYKVKFEVYPNPVSEGIVTIHSPNMANDEVNLQLYNMIGQSVLANHQTFKDNGELKFNIGSQQSGVYFLEISHQGNKINKRIIIK